MLNQLFALCVLILGLVMLVTNFQIDHSLRQQHCEDDALNNANKGILVLAVAAVVSSLAYMACAAKCSGLEETVLATELYAGFALVLGIVLISLGSVINSRAGAVPSCASAKHHANTVITIGVIMTVACGSYLGWYAYENMGGRDAVNRVGGYMKAKSGM